METTKKIKLLDFKLSKAIGGLLFGVYKSKFHGNGIDFYEHKEYVYGEPVKNIDWKTSSKTEKFYSKIFEEEKELDVLFLIDVNSSMLFSSGDKLKKDILEEIFYSLSFSAYKNSDNFGVILFDGNNQTVIPYKKDFGNIFKTISHLENINKTEKIDENRVEKILDFLVKNKLKNNLIFVLSDFIFEENNKNLKILGLRNEVIFINVFDFLENKLSENLGEITLNSENDFLNISLNTDKIKEFNKIREEKLKKFQNILKKNNIGYIYLDTKKDIFREIMLYFSKI